MWVVVLCLVLLLVATLYVAGYFQLVVQRGEEYDPVTLLQTTEIRIYSEPWMVHVYWPLAFVQAKISQREIILMSVENGRIIVAE